MLWTGLPIVNCVASCLCFLFCTLPKCLNHSLGGGVIMWEHPSKDFMVVDKKIMKEVQYLMIELQLFFPLLFCKNELTGGREVQG